MKGGWVNGVCEGGEMVVAGGAGKCERMEERCAGVMVEVSVR